MDIRFMPKIISKLTIILLAITMIALTPCNAKEVGKAKGNDWKGASWINFEWIGDSIGTRYFDKVAMFVPVKFDGIPRQFKAEFDLGSMASIVYGNSFNPYLSLYPEYASKLDTVNTEVSIENKKQGDFKNVTLFLGNFEVRLHILPYYKNYGDTIPVDSVNSPSVKNIGTIGADVVKDKILIIDYPQKRMTILDSLSSGLNRKFDFVTCKMQNGRFIVPLTVHGKVQWYMFDTGASLFSLVTDGDNWNSICNTAQADTVKIGSWGTFYNVYGAPTNEDIYLGKIKLPQTIAYKMTLRDYLDMFKQEQISGSIGNAYFFNDIIALDFKNGRFGVMVSVDK